MEQKRALIEPAHPQLSIRRPCLVLGFARSTRDDRPLGESVEKLHRMRVLDEQDTATPFYGIRRMTAWLRQRG
jgi:putative transposase